MPVEGELSQVVVARDKASETVLVNDLPLGTDFDLGLGVDPRGAKVCRVEEGKPLTDIQRSGRPRRFSEAARLMTIAVYCQHSPPLPGIHLWSLRDAQRYFKEHLETIGGPISHATIHRILLDHALRPHRRKYYLQITDPDFFPKMEHIIGHLAVS